MKIDDKPGLELIAEFQNIEIEIKVLGQSYVNGDLIEILGDEDSCDPSTLSIEWSFEFKFNNDFIVHHLDYGKPRLDYKDFIIKKVNDFYREIGDLVEKDSDYSEKMIILNDYRTRFTLISEVYTEEEYSYCRIKCILLNHKNVRIKKDSDNNISEYEFKNILHSFLIIQKQAISNILFFLESKIELLREIGNYEVVKAKTRGTTRKIEPIETLNKYQTALLFDYLKDTGAIHTFQANTLAPLISQLTGHSEHNIRTEALNKIIDIKKGSIGDLRQIIKDPDVNIRVVRNIIKSILSKIDEDLDKNKKLRENKKL